ncbi:hypothetical protein [Gynurincola endophyticus]|uniref:hypothetical protein n=1 Tax=Gynurincola endophyticus TaxID=2479004 RepID=UPI000F8CBFB1|nr:hypothetical protein [Gynurincola endophyticus]
MNSLKNIFLILLSVVFFGTACTKTEDLPPLSQSQLLSFKVATLDGELVAAVDQTDKTITIYVPFYYEFDVIDPIITVSAGARLKEEVLPVSVLADDVQYTVIGSDNSETVYALTVKLLQLTPLTMRELSSETNTATMVIGAYNVKVYGSFNTTDASKITIFVVDEEGNEYPTNANTGFGPASVAVTQNGNGLKEYSFGNIQIPQTLTPGLYYIRGKVLGQVGTTKYPVRMVWGLPVFVYATIDVKATETFKLETASAALNDVRRVYFIVNGVEKDLEIVSQTYRDVTVRVPSDMPPGSYNPKVVCGTVGTASPFWNITISE